MVFIKELGLTWERGLIILIIIALTLITVRIIRWLITKAFKKASVKIKVDPTRYKFFKNALSFIIWTIAIGIIVLTVPKFKALAITIFAGAGIFLAILGFAAQQAFSNIVSGVFIVIFRPFRVGDMIKVGDLEYGTVEDISLRHTVIINFENKRIIIPNSVISSATILNDNIDDPKICRWVGVSISYDSDLDVAMEIMRDVSAEHPKCIDARTPAQIKSGEHKVNVNLIEFGDSGLHLRAYVWTNDPFYARQMHADINLKIRTGFNAAGIEIPFPHITLVQKGNAPKEKI